MQETQRADARRAVIFPLMGCCGGYMLLNGVGIILGFYYPYALLLVSIASVIVGGAVGSRGRPRLRRAFTLSVLAVVAADLIIALNHNGPIPLLYLAGDVAGIAVGTAASFLISKARPAELN